MRWVYLLFLLLVTGVSFSQDATVTPPPPEINAPISATFRVDNETPLLGEPFTITLEVVAAPDITLQEWVSFDMPLEILEEGEVETEALSNGDIQYTRDYRAILWDVGDYLSEDMVVTYIRGGNLSSVPITSFFVQVPILISNLDEASLRPPVPPVDLPYISPYVFVAIGVVFVIVLMIIARLVQMSRRGVVQIVKASPAEKAIAEIEDLKVQNLPAATVYELIALSLRQYLQGQFEIDASEMTTAELSQLLREQTIFPKVHRQRLQQVLEQADLVKFARFQPDETSSIRLANFAIKWLKETERIQQHA